MNAPLPLLNVDGLCKSFGSGASWLARMTRRKTFGRALRAVDDVSFSIEAGSTLSLVGESGCGKSTIARCVAGLHTPTHGAVTFRGKDMSEIAARNLPERREVQMIFQDPYASLNPRWEVGRSIADPMTALRLVASKRQRADAVADLLERVGLSADDAAKFPHQFSGGQRQRVAIARALSTRPSLIVCDEPTSALDVSVQAQVLNTMRDLQDELGLTYLFISHNLAVVEHMSDRIGVMYLGRLVEIGDRATIFSRPLHPYTRMLVDSVPGGHHAQHGVGGAVGSVGSEVANPHATGQGCAYHQRCSFANARCRQERPELKAHASVLVACHRIGEIA